MEEGVFMNKRDDFTSSVKSELARTVGFRCSNPACGVSTAGPNKNFTGSVNLGVAAHICAASKGGPRYDSQMTSEERRSFANGIWLCQSCSRLIDVDFTNYTVELLSDWKKEAMSKAQQRMTNNSELHKERFLKKEKKILKKIQCTMEDSNSKYMIKEFDFGNDYNRKNLDQIYELREFLNENYERVENGELQRDVLKFTHAITTFVNHLVYKGGPSSRIPGAHDIELKSEQTRANDYATEVWNIYHNTLKDYIDEIQ